ncbi:flagellar type III secretion system pore protein FliP [Jannaschia formosa]|uniref:flagellar type III secretion system pore protein FliP n=1 Tax=Jannaschia formosa TaxID=2259592 RepID=UPI000E1C07BD|nr:flagellar type III secretion system pore protein FliP [Jannaschia formosa]TFL18446.1 flagellar type III secretion system pore protein FliP [Jannaschia formosa]
MRRWPLWLLLAAATLPGAATAQDLQAVFGDEGSLSLRAMQMIALITVLSLAPGIAITVTCFPFIVTVLSILRQAIGLQASPPNMLIVSLAMFLTYFVMEPVFAAAWTDGLQPLSRGELSPEAGFAATIDPFRGFMAARVDPETLEHLRALRPAAEADSLAVLVPSFLLSEISRAFQIGFLVFMPFLIIDMVAAAVLMSMGMMMVPPAIVSLPFKLAFFVVVDGWTLVASALVRSYV